MIYAHQTEFISFIKWKYENLETVKEILDLTIINYDKEKVDKPK